MENDKAELQALAPVEEPQFDFAEGAPDLYADSVHVSMGPFGLALTFAVTEVANPEHRRVISTVRMSPQLAFTIVQLMRRVLRRAKEEGVGLSPNKAVIEQLQLDEEL